MSRRHSQIDKQKQTLVQQNPKHVLQTFVMAYKAACSQENYFLYPKRVFEDVTTGQQLMRQVEILTPFMWYCEQNRKVKEQDLMSLRACWIRMKDEADLVLRAEFLIELGTRSDMDSVRELLTIAKKRNFLSHGAIVALENHRLSLTQ